MPYDTWSVFSLVLAIVSTLLDNCLLLVQVLCSLSFPFSLTTSLSFFFPSCLFHTPPLFFDKISCSGLALSSPWRMTLNSWAFYLHLLCIGVSSVHCHVVSAWQNQLPCGFCSVGCRTQGFLYVGQAYSQPSHLPSWILIFWGYETSHIFLFSETCWACFCTLSTSKNICWMNQCITTVKSSCRFSGRLPVTQPDYLLWVGIWKPRINSMEIIFKDLNKAICWRTMKLLS